MTATRTAELVLDARARLGEGPCWDADAQVVWWVDIDGHRVHRFSPADGTDTSVDVGQPVGVAVPRRGGGLLAGLQDGFFFLDFDSGALDPFADPEPDKPGNRINDAKVDRAGRLWGGTMSIAREPRQGGFYRLDPDGTLTTVLTGVDLSNGLGWSPDDTRLYYIDTPTRGVDVFDFDAQAGQARNRRRLVDVPEDAGRPDGMAVDADGCLWVALWGGWAVHRYAPDGVLDTVVDVPAARVTCPTFGGDDLGDLYITTASADADSPEQPHAGGIFHVRPGVGGLPTHRFGG